MNCFFCQKICRPIATSYDPPLGYTTNTTQCDYHASITVRHYEGSGVGGIYPITSSNQIVLWASEMICLFKDNKYRIFIYHDKRDKPFSVCQSKISKSRYLEVIFALDFIPDINPENLDQKLPIYLKFI